MGEENRRQTGYRAFISYSHRDQDWGAWLHRALETYRVPKNIVGKETPYGPIPRRLTPIFRDRDELATADDLSAEITAALEQSKFLVVICSPASAQSKWVNEEIKTFKRLHGEGLVRAIIVGGQPFAPDGHEADECFPEALRFKLGPDGELTNERAEPIAADLRPGGDGKKYALSKLVAGLTGAKLDELVQREQQRRTKQLTTIAASMAIVAAGSLTLAWIAMESRARAKVAEADAVVARDDAETRREKAEGLVEFMITDLRQKLDAVNRLDVLDSTAQKTLDYYADQSTQSLDPDALGRRARAMLLFGEVHNSRGDLDKALEAYQQAAATTQEQLRRDPDNPQRIFDHSQSVFYVGYIAWLRGDATTARDFWAEYRDQAERLVSIDPDNDDYQAELEYSYSNLGTLAMDQGDAEEAEEWFQQSLGVSSRLVEKYPDDADRIIAAGQSYSWLAEALYHQAKIEEALEARIAELALYESHKKEPDHALIEDGEAVARYGLADILLASGRVEDALAEAQKAVALADKLLTQDPDNLDRADRAALALTVLGEANLHSGNLAEARQSFSIALSISEQMLAKDNSVMRWRGKVGALPAFLLGRIEEKENRASTAHAAYSNLIETVRPLIETNTPEKAVELVYSAALAGQARLSPQPDGNWNDIITVLAPNEDKHGAKTLTVLIEARANQNRMHEAAALSAKLYGAGYRHPDFMALLETHTNLLPQNSDAAAAPPSPH